MASAIPSVPTPNQWVDKKLRELGLSNASLARMVGQDRTRVQRWINSREQIPRHSLAEIAAQLGTPEDLENALKIKEHEDLKNSLKRKFRDLSKIGTFNSSEIEFATFSLLEQKTSQENWESFSEYLSTLIYNMTHASFIFRIWCDAAYSRDFRSILTSENSTLHFRYPTHYFFGLLLNFDGGGDRMTDFRAQCLGYLRNIATARHENSATQLSYHHHAIHTLARFGTLDDHATVSEIVEKSVASTEPLAVRLGHAGLMLRPGSEEFAERYIWLLQHDEQLASVDVAFEAVHYGDVRPGKNQQLPRELNCLDKTISNALRRLQQESHEAVRELEIYRLHTILDSLNPNTLSPSSFSKLKFALEEILSTDRSSYSKEIKKKIAKLTKEEFFDEGVNN